MGIKGDVKRKRQYSKNFDGNDSSGVGGCLQCSCAYFLNQGFMCTPEPSKANCMGLCSLRFLNHVQDIYGMTILGPALQCMLFTSKFPYPWDPLKECILVIHLYWSPSTICTVLRYPATVHLCLLLLLACYVCSRAE